MHIAVGKQRIESLYRTDSGEIELKEQMIKNNEAKAGTSKQCNAVLNHTQGQYFALCNRLSGRSRCNLLRNSL